MNQNELTTKQQNNNQQELRELQQLWKELGISSSSIQQDDGRVKYDHQHGVDAPTAPTRSTSAWQPLLCLGFGTAVLFNIGILCSLPPVLRGRGTTSFVHFANL